MRPVKKFLAKTYIRKHRNNLPTIGEDNTLGQYHIIQVTELNYPSFYLLQQHFSKNPKQITIQQGDLSKRLAVIATYRNREQHLRQFIPAVTARLNQEKIIYDIYVIHQVDSKLFNRGALSNIGFALHQQDYDYFCFHDVDNIPIETTYRYINHPCCLRTAEHLACFGGVVLLTKQDFQAINGFSNRFWNWGFEDENLRDRCHLAGLVPIRLSDSRYQELHHPHSTTQTPDGNYHTDKKTLKSLLKAKRMNRRLANDYKHGKLDYQLDGLNSLVYKLIKRTQFEGYTMIDVAL